MKELISRMSVKEKIGGVAALAFLLLVFVDRMVVDPVNLRMRQLNQEINIGEKKLAQYLRYMNQKGIVTNDYRKYEKFVKKSGSDEEEQTKILGEIEELARKTKVSMANMKPLPPRSVDFYRTYEISIEVEGDMEAIVDFLYAIGNSAQLLRAEKVRINLKEKESPVVKGYLSVTKVVMP